MHERLLRGLRPRGLAEARERGSAMILVVFVMLLVTALATVGTKLAISGERSSNQSQRAGTALSQ